jgi:hypothetical protein
MAAAFGASVVFVVAIALSFLAEPRLKRWAPKTNSMLGRVGFGLSVRYALRDASLVVLVARSYAQQHPVDVALVAAGVVALIAARAGIRFLAQRTADRRTAPVTTRNIDLSGCRIPEPLPPWIAGGADTAMLFVAGAALVSPILGSATAVAAMTSAAAAFACALIVVAAPVARAAGRMPSAKTTMAEVRRQIDRYAPEVVIYFSGTRSSMYQIDMWLPVAARLRQRVLIVLRDRANLPLLGATELPVVCLPDPVDVLNFSIPSMRLVLYPAHTGNNIHFLRIPGVMHAFICHGESDKLANVNPYSKAYDQVWVAGPAARERYARADVGVRDEDIIEVGGPQLALIQHADRDASGSGSDRGLTVLYAPTWEGWTDEPQNTSVTAAGPGIVATLLAHPDVARVIYKPHPLTGTRSAAAARSSGAIVAMLGPEHLVVTGTEPDLYHCFNACDVLVGDISGVLTDFLVSEKPYVVTNSSGLDAEAFRGDYPTTRAAYLIGPDAVELGDLLTGLYGGDDPMAPERRALRAYILGEDVFADAVDRAVEAAEQRMERRGDLIRSRPSV